MKLSKAKAANISLTGITFFQLTYVKRKMIYVKISKIMIIKCLVCKRGEKTSLASLSKALGESLLVPLIGRKSKKHGERDWSCCDGN